MKIINSSVSTIKDLRFYLIDYKTRRITNEFDTVKDTIFLSKVNNTEDLYINHFENVIYVKNILLNNPFKNIVLKQGKKVYIIQDKRDNLNLLIPLDKNNKIYVYKDYKVLDMLSQEKSLEYFIEDSNIYDNEYEVLEVKFNGKKLENFTFDGVLKKISIGANILDYQYINNIQVVLAKKVKNINDVEFVVEHIDHSIFDKNDPIKVVADTYFDISYIMNRFEFKRGNYDNFEINSVMNNKAIHKKAKNFRTEMTIAVRNISEHEQTGSYGSGLYGSGLYGGGNLTFTGIMNKSIRFRFIIYNTLNGEILIVNNCKANEDYSKQYNDDLNIVEYIVNGDRELQYISKVADNGYKYYELCFI